MAATAALRAHLRSAGITCQGAQAVEHLRDQLVGGLVLVPQPAVLEIARIELPSAVGLVEPLLQALALLVLEMCSMNLRMVMPFSLSICSKALICS